MSTFFSREDDIFIASFPKSGSTLIQMMLYQIITDGTMDIPHIDGVVRWFERWLRQGRGDVLNALPSPRMFKSHLPLGSIPNQSKAIYLLRDPKDVCVSAYHHCVDLRGRVVSISEFIDEFLSGFERAGSWFDHLENSLPYIHSERILPLRYEAVCSDLKATVNKICSFLSLSITATKCEVVVERCSLDFMRRFEEKFSPAHRADSKGRFIRRGGSGSGSQELSHHAVRQIDNELARRLKRLREKVSPAAIEFAESSMVANRS